MVLLHKLLKISSKDMDLAGSTSTSDFVVNLNTQEGIQGVKSAIVKQVSIMNTFYNINDSNNTLTYNIASSPSAISISNGQYNITTLISALETAATGIGLTITQNTITGILALATTTAVEWLPLSQGNAMAEVLGILEGSGSDVTNYIPKGLPNLSGIDNVFIQSKTLGENNLIGTNEGSILAVIPITTAFGVVTHYVSNHAEIDDIDSSSIQHGKNSQKIDIKLLDGRGNPIDLMGTHITIILKIYY